MLKRNSIFIGLLFLLAMLAFANPLNGVSHAASFGCAVDCIGFRRSAQKSRCIDSMLHFPFDQESAP